MYKREVLKDVHYINHVSLVVYRPYNIQWNLSTAIALILLEPPRTVASKHIQILAWNIILGADLILAWNLILGSDLILFSQLILGSVWFQYQTFFRKGTLNSTLL